MYLRYDMDRVKRIWYLSPMRAAKVQASLRIRAVSPEPSLLAHTSSESRGNFRQKARSLAPLNGWACAVKICHDGMLEDTNSLDGAHIKVLGSPVRYCIHVSRPVSATRPILMQKKRSQNGNCKCHTLLEQMPYVFLLTKSKKERTFLYMLIMVVFPRFPVVWSS